VEPNQALDTALAGRYEIEREIGAGGMATVYLALDVKHHRKVALKVLKPELGAVLGVERFLAEIQVTANLQHPNLLPLFDSGEAGGLLFYVMPYVEGESLRARLEREKQLPIDEAVRLAVGIASALEYAHGHGVIHRDLKPENILLQAGQPVIADFGIALAVSKAGGTRITQTGLSLGTPQYMSPEQATGDRTIDGRSDIYSLGAVTYEMLTGEPPHMGTTAQAIIARVLTEHPRSVRSMRPHVPEYVEQALENALEKLPADRMSTAGQFADALQGKSVAGSSLVATRAATAAQGQAGRRWRARLRDPLVLGLAGVAAAAVVAAWVTSASARRSESQDSAVVRFPLSLPSGVNIASSGAALGRNVAISPDGKIVAFVGTLSTTVTQLFLRKLDEVQPRAIPGTDNALEPFFSPDGRWIGFWTPPGKLQKVSVDGGPVVPLADMPLPSGISWSSKDVIVAALTSGLGAIPAAGGTPRLVAKIDVATGEVTKRWPIVLSDGETVLYESWKPGGSERQRIAVASLATGASTILDVAGVSPLGVLDGRLVYATASQALMAVPFDVRSRRVTGAPTPILSDVVVGSLGAAKAAISATGSLVYQSGLQTSQVVLADAQGTIRPLLAAARAYAFPRYSPDGKRVALTITQGAGSDIWLYDIPGATMARLTTDGSFNERPEWSPDGKHVLFRSERRQRSGLWWQPSDLSGAAEPLLVNDSADFWEGVIAPDGRSLVYQLDTAGAQIFSRPLAGDSTPKPIAATGAVTDSPRLSPDGRWIAFASNSSGIQQVVVQPFPGPGGQVQVSTTGGLEPVWSRDGRRLFYRDGEHLVAATVVTSPTFAVTSREALFRDTFVRAPSPHSNYDVAPDGTHFLFLNSTESSQVIVVHNWLDELRARLAEKASK